MSAGGERLQQRASAVAGPGAERAAQGRRLALDARQDAVGQRGRDRAVAREIQGGGGLVDVQPLRARVGQPDPGGDHLLVEAVSGRTRDHEARSTTYR